MSKIKSLEVVFVATALAGSVSVVRAADSIDLRTMFKMLRRTSSPEERRKIIESGVRLKDISVASEMPAIVEAVDDVDPFVRFRAARFLIGLALTHPEASTEFTAGIEAVRKHLLDPYFEWQGAWPQTFLDLLTITHPESSRTNMQVALDYLYDSEDSTVRSAIFALATMKPCARECVEALVTRMNVGKLPGVRGAVIKAIGENRISDDAALEALNQAILKGEKSEQIAAAKAFGQIGTAARRYQASLEELQQATTDPDVRSSVGYALKRIQ